MTETTEQIENKVLNEYEKELLKGTITPIELNEQEPVEYDRDPKKERIMMIKFVAMFEIGENPLKDTRYIHGLQRKHLVEWIKTIEAYSEETLKEAFDTACLLTIFKEGFDASKYRVSYR